MRVGRVHGDDLSGAHVQRHREKRRRERCGLRRFMPNEMQVDTVVQHRERLRIQSLLWRRLRRFDVYGQRHERHGDRRGLRWFVRDEMRRWQSLRG